MQTDPLGVRQFDEGDDANKLILTTEKRAEKAEKRDLAIQQIEKRFTAVKSMKVGMSKGPGQSGVTATQVFDFLPMVKLLPSKTIEVACDDTIADELPSKRIVTNDFMLYQFND